MLEIDRYTTVVPSSAVRNRESTTGCGSERSDSEQRPENTFLRRTAKVRDSAGNIVNLINAVKGLRTTIGGKRPGIFGDRHKSLAEVLGVTCRDTASLIKVETRSTEETAGLLRILTLLERRLPSTRASKGTI